MIGESIAILVVLLVAGTMAVRRGGRALGGMVIPFLGVPLFYLLGQVVFRPPDERQRIAILAAGALAGVAVAFLVSKSLEGRFKSPRRTYVPFAIVFILLLAGAYLIRN